MASTSMTWSCSPSRPSLIGVASISLSRVAVALAASAPPGYEEESTLGTKIALALVVSSEDEEEAAIVESPTSELTLAKKSS